MKRTLTVALLVASLLFSQTALAGAGQHAPANDPVEPDAGSWRTWVISSGEDYRVPPPPSPSETQAELLRVCRAGGRVALANWTPTGFIGRMFKATAAHVPPPGVPSPLLWGDEAAVRERLRDGVAELYFNRRTVAFRLPLTPERTVDFFREWYGPTLRAFASLNEDGQAALRRDLTRLWSEHNLATDGTTHVESEYLEVVAKKRGRLKADSQSVNTHY